jgi:four helix bundle protein
MKKIHLKFKDLQVWQKTIDYADQVIEMTENLNTKRQHFRLIEQLESSAASISQNISEGKGRYSKKEFVQFLYFSRASLYETVTLINLLIN